MSILGKYYMTTAEEIAKHEALCAMSGETPLPTGSYGVIEAMAGGDPVLLEALWTFWNFEHAYDDLIDLSGWTAAMIEAAMMALFDEVCVALGFEPEQKTISAHNRTMIALLRVTAWPEMRQMLAIDAQHAFLTALRNNPLYRDNRGDFRALFAQCIFRALDGEAMANSDDPRRQQLAPAVKCGDLEVMFHLVYLAHGWARARQVSSLRDYDQPDMKEVK